MPDRASCEVLRVLRAMMESAGFEDIEEEDRWWDEGDDEAKDTRRQDITAFNPRNRRRYVIDVVGAWAIQPGGGQGWQVEGAWSLGGRQGGEEVDELSRRSEAAEGGRYWVVGEE